MAKLKKVIEEVKKILKKDKRGLTIQELSDAIGVSRITVSMALMNLAGAGLIQVRSIGNCKLHYASVLLQKTRRADGGK
ncbi:MAG: GntR family transcriptional regulator [Nanoarchaeota archaeon]|nr:GntR family transcriptional regulator [Nanoarchaeota archaeon]